LIKIYQIYMNKILIKFYEKPIFVWIKKQNVLH